MKEMFKDLVLRVREADPGSALAVRFWDGETVGSRDDSQVLLCLNSENAARKILCEGFLGFGEAYTEGDLEIEGNLQELLRLGIAVKHNHVRPPFRKKVRLILDHLKNSNHLGRANKNITHHYDRGEEFYSLYLDKTLTYSCAYFKDPEDSLEKAQWNKYEHIARKLMLKEGESLIDVGCGWGGMLIHAARNYGVTGVGNTLSPRQCEYANQRIRELGLQDRIQVVLKDYRHMAGRFDKFVSIGMFEHVGRNFIPAFMEKVSQWLNPGGVGLLHTIGKDTYSPFDLWTMRYIFPGAYLPNLPEIAQHMGEKGLTIVDVENLRLHYAKTLDCWAGNFEKNVEKAREMFGESFVRMWRLYLHASSANFKHGQGRLYQVLFSNGLNNSIPMTRDHCYVN